MKPNHPTNHPQWTSETHNPNNEYENFVTTHMQAAAESIKTKSRAKIRVFLESMAVRKKRDNPKKASLIIKRTPMNKTLRKPWENNEAKSIKLKIR